MLEFEQTNSLIKEAQKGSEEAKSTLLRENSPLVKSVIRRYRGKGVDYDDLYQLGCIGFLKAIRNFSFDFNVKFSTYAVPMIAGEVKRFLRDDGYIKVSRSVKGMSSKINMFSEQYRQKTGESPNVETIAKEFGIDATDVVFVLDSAKMPLSIYDESEDRAQIIDKLPSAGDENDRINNIMLCDLIRSLPERDKKIIVLRYYRDRTQCEVARILGVSQVQVSRLENKILNLLKQEIAQGE